VANASFGRWTQYARDGHGGNIALKALAVSTPRTPGISCSAS
jgi:hypothetical protein